MPLPTEPKIPESLWAEVYQRHKDGQTDPQIAAWLKEAHKIPATKIDVWRTRQRYVKRVVEVVPIRGTEALPLAGPAPTKEALDLPTLPAISVADGDLLHHWMHRLSHAAHRAEAREDELLMQAHLRTLTHVAEVRRKIHKDLIDAGQASGPGAVPLSADEEAAALEAVRLKALSLYELAPPETLPAPGPGAPLPSDGGKLVN